MFNKFQGILASRSAATALALTLFVGLTVPFVVLQGTRAFAAPPPLQCTEGNNNGCTELSATPPEDLQSVPPNLVLMLDDSGSMAWDFMPDWGYLSNTSVYGTRNSGVNAVYYNPETAYTPPPKATATDAAWQADTTTWYPNSPSMTGAYTDGFTNTAATNIVGGSGYVGGGNGNTFNYTDNLATTLFNTTPPTDKGPAVWGGGTPYIPGSDGSPANPGGGCIANYQVDPGNSNQCIRAPVSPTRLWTCNQGDGNPYNASNVKMCHHRTWQEGIHVDTPYAATDGGLKCPSGTTGPGSDDLCHYPPIGLIPPSPEIPPTDPVPATPNYKWICPSGGSFTGNPAGPPATAPKCWTSGTSTRVYVRAFTYVVGNPVQRNSHYVVPNGADAPAGGWCSVLNSAWQKANCVNVDDASGTAAPAGVTAGQNVANWFSYYRTRMQMAKSSLMTAFISVDPKYRFGFASINGNGTSNITASPTSYAFDDSTTDGTGGNDSNKLAVVQPFGDGSTGTQKAQFWTWLANISGNKGTPLRKALNAVGQYYQTADPWKMLSGDPGWTAGSTTNTTQFTCRSSYTILTTDGFWNGDAPASPSSIGNVANTDGPVNTAPQGRITQYKAQLPYSGGGLASGDPSLADVATYYWERDLNTSLANEVAAGKSDPASWQHMTTFTIGLGFKPTGIDPVGTTIPQVFGWATGGAAITDFGWPTPASDTIYNIADLAHAAVNGHGDFYNVTDPTSLAEAFSKALADIGARNVPPRPVGVNASVLTVGAAVFSTGYATSDWSGQFLALALKNDGTVAAQLWQADNNLDALYHSPSAYANRHVYTTAYDAGTGALSKFQFTVGNKSSLDSIETSGLELPALAGGDDTLDNRIKYLLGDNTYEAAPYRTRTSILGAIIHSDPVYVAGASGNYRGNWPGTSPPELATGAQTYAAFTAAQAARVGMAYVGANDGMLHGFYAPVPKCTGTVGADGICSGAYTYQTLPGSANPGDEAWAFVPRAVYANLGNLTNNSSFQFRPTVDSTPVMRDVFFSDGGTHNNKWRTILTGGVGLGGRGVYAIDITDPSTSFSTSNVLWEFDSDMAVDSGCVSIVGTSSTGSCRGTDLGYTVAQPNMGRLANGKWVVLVPNGYFPDCTTPDAPTASTADCKAIAADAPAYTSGEPYSALFVLDAQTGKMLAELKTPVVSGVTSFGLARPVLGDYQSDQVDDVAFAGDVQGNMWRFDLSDADPTKWTVSLVYQGLSQDGHQGVQPITVMPRLFPDPISNRFLVLFGTGKYLGVGDNTNVKEQSIYAVRDTAGTAYTQADLVQQYMHETTVAAGQPNAGAVLRCVTGRATDDCTTSVDNRVNPVSSSAGGWYINLYIESGGTQINAGERIVVNPGAIFSSNTVLFETLITGAVGSDACSPTTQGAIMALNAASGGPGSVSALGGWPIAGARIQSARTSGNLPIVSAMGGGKGYLPGASLLTPAGSATVGSPFSTDLNTWRRRSWQVLMNEQ